MQENLNQGRRKINILLLVIVCIAISAAILLPIYLSRSENKTNAEIKELVVKYNQSCPLTIQVGIRLDSVTLPRERRVQYNLTLLNIEKETAEVKLIEQEIRKTLISTAKANPGLQVFRDKDYILIYHYSDKKKAFLFDIEIFPDQYK